MVLTIPILLLLAAFILAVASAAGKAPLWAAVILLNIWALMSVLPR